MSFLIPFKFNETVYVNHSLFVTKAQEGYRIDFGKTKRGSWAHVWVAKSYSKRFSSKPIALLKLPARNMRLIKSENVLILAERNDYYSLAFEVNSGYRGSCEAIISVDEHKLILTPQYVVLSKIRFLDFNSFSILTYPIYYSENGKLGSSLGLFISVHKDKVIEIPFLRTGEKEISPERGVIKIFDGILEVEEEI